MLQQAARELLLLESSDWPFLVTTGQAREYATDRFNDHVGRFNDLADALLSPELPGEALQRCREYYERDNLFPDIDYTLFRAREEMGKQA